MPFGAEIAARVRNHHECNGGMSRYEKLPVYLKWARQDPTAVEVDRYSARFSAFVTQAVIKSPWVPGAREYLQANRCRQRFVLLTATPQTEIDEILSVLQI